MATVKVSTRDTSDNVQINSQFDYELPPNLDDAKSRYGEEQVFKLFTKALTLELQSPGRRELISQWESLPADERAGLTTQPDSPDGVAKATLPAMQQSGLQDFMTAWKLGDRAQRTRAAASTDPVGDLMRAIEAGTITPGRVAELQALVAEKFPPRSGRNRG